MTVGSHRLPIDAAVREQRFGEVSLPAAVLSPAAISAALERLRERREGLASLPRAVRIDAVAEAARRLALLDDGALIDALAATTGFSRPMIAEGLARCFRAVTADDLAQLAPDGLDPAPLVGIVSAGNLPGVAIAKTSLALAAGSAVFVKSASGEPVLAPAFARVLDDVDSRVGSALAAAWWPGGDVPLDRALAAGVDTLVAYGSDEAVEALGNLGARTFVGYGHRVSLALVRAGDAAGAAAGLALDVALHDQLGCLSPGCCFVVGPPDESVALARAVTDRLEACERDLPCGSVPEPAALAIRRLVDEIEWRGIAGEAVAAFDAGRAGCVVVESSPDFRPGPLHRTLIVIPLESAADLPARLGPATGRLEAVGIWPAGDDELERAAREAGAARVAPVGEMQRPGLDWWQGNRSPLTGIERESPR